MNYFQVIWPSLQKALEATYVSIEIAVVGAIIAWLQLRYAKARDKTLDGRNSWEKIHKAMLEFRFRRELLNSPIESQAPETLAVDAAEALHNLKGELDRAPDSPLVTEISMFLNENESAGEWRAEAFTGPFDGLAHKAALKSR